VDPSPPPSPHHRPFAVAEDVGPAVANRLGSARLILVTGKGGTGKSSVSLVTARALAARGERTLLIEVDAETPTLGPALGVASSAQPVEVVGTQGCLWVVNLKWPDVLAAWLSRTLPISSLVQAVLANDRMRRFLDFTPGARDLVELSAIDDAVGRWGRVVVDLPASGHAFSMLDVTRSALSLFRGGPVRRRAEELRARVTSPETRCVFVAIPESMVVNETLETRERMARAGLLGAKPMVVLNRAWSSTWSPQAITALDAARAAAAAYPDQVPAGVVGWLGEGAWRLDRQRATEAAKARLAAAFGDVDVVVEHGALGWVRA
jgi:arsenite-transporting ATPase